MQKEIKIKVKGIKGDTPTDEQLVELIKPLIPEPLKGEDGESPTDEKLVSLITPLIPEPKNGETPTDDRLIGLIKPLIILPEVKEQIEETPNTLVTKVNKSNLKIEKDRLDVDWDEYKNKETTVEDVKGLPETIRQMQHRYTQVAGGGTNVTLKTNDVANPTQTELNLKAGTNITLTPDAYGAVTIASTGGGGGGLTNPVDYIQFNTGATPQPNAEGLLQWNATDGTLDLGMDGGDITMQMGQEMFTKVRNQSGSTILNGKAVYFSGRLGNRPLISLAIGDADSTSRVTGITTEDITSPNDGFITTVGYVRGIKTDYTGAGDWGTTWVEGDILYVSKTVAGQITNVEPDIPHHSDIIGSVGIVHSSLGSILINIERHRALEGLSDVNGTAPIEGSILSYHDGVGEQYFDFTANITDFLSKTITISNPTVMTSTPIISVPNASTITSIKVLCIGGTSITGNVDVLDNNGTSPTPVNADVTAVAGTESTYTSFASPTVASGYYIGWHTTSISGVPSKVIISVTYTLN